MSGYEGHLSKEASKEFKIYSLVSFTTPHEKAMKQKAIVPLSPNISSLEDENRSSSFLICNYKKNQIFYTLWQYKLDKNINLNFEENRSLLSSMTRYASKWCQVDEIIGLPFPIIAIYGIFNWKLTNIEVGYILHQCFQIIIELRGLKSA